MNNPVRRLHVPPDTYLVKRGTRKAIDPFIRRVHQDGRLLGLDELARSEQLIGEHSSAIESYRQAV